MKLKGLAAFRNDLKKLSDDKQTKVVGALNMTGLDIQRVATKFAPVNKQVGKGGGVLKNSNTFVASTKNDPVIQVGNKAKYAPYMEFGTGTKVKVPKGYEDVANKYRGRGIRKVNIKANPPYLIPSIELNTPKLIARLKKIFSK